MIKRIVILALLVFFVVGTASVMAEGNAACKDKGALQSLYNWFGSWDKLCVNKSERCCKTCVKKCCSNCNMDCGGTCCADCGKK